jgi:hypothetical protein
MKNTERYLVGFHNSYRGEFAIYVDKSTLISMSWTTRMMAEKFMLIAEKLIDLFHRKENLQRHGYKKFHLLSLCSVLLEMNSNKER